MFGLAGALWRSADFGWLYWVFGVGWVVERFALSVLGTPVKGWDPLVVSLFGLVPAMCLVAVDRQSGSRWSARSAARTNDLEADEDPPHTRLARTRRKRLWFKSSAALP